MPLNKLFDTTRYLLVISSDLAAVSGERGCGRKVNLNKRKWKEKNYVNVARDFIKLGGKWVSIALVKWTFLFISWFTFSYFFLLPSEWKGWPLVWCKNASSESLCVTVTVNRDCGQSFRAVQTQFEPCGSTGQSSHVIYTMWEIFFFSF